MSGPIFGKVRNEKINNYVRQNSPSSIIGTPGDNWKTYLKANGGTGDTFYDLEQGFLRSKGSLSFADYIVVLGFTVGYYWDRLRNWLNSVGGSNSRLLLETGGYILLENGDRILLG